MRFGTRKKKIASDEMCGMLILGIKEKKTAEESSLELYPAKEMTSMLSRGLGRRSSYPGIRKES